MVHNTLPFVNRRLNVSIKSANESFPNNSNPFGHRLSHSAHGDWRTGRNQGNVYIKRQLCWQQSGGHNCNRYI
jgi:hypothetical protein